MSDLGSEGQLNMDNCKDSVEFKTVSQSICLGGVYVTNNIKDTERCKGQLVENKDHALLAERRVEEHFEIVKFSNEKCAKTFHRLLRTLGYSAALQYYKHHTASVENNPPTHLERSAFCIVSLAEWTPNIKDMSLSRLAIRFLRSIEEKLNDKDGDKNLAKETCLSFFKVFGTHVYTGVVRFGGIFEITIKSKVHEGENFEEKEDLFEKIYNKVVLDHIFVDAKKHKEQKNETNGSEFVFSREHFEVTNKIIGGPKETQIYSKWKTELLKNTQTWALVDLGEISFERCVGVWSLLRRNQTSFCDVEKLSVFLAQTWMCHIAGGDVSGLLSDYNFRGLIRTVESTLQSNNSLECYLKSLNILLEFLMRIEDLIGKPNIIKVMDFASEDTIKNLFKDSANQKHPVKECFQIMTTKLKILKLDEGKSPLLGLSWIVSEGFFIQGLLSKRDFKDIEELLSALEGELLPGLRALEACCDIDVKQVLDVTNNEILNSVNVFLERRLRKNDYLQALLILVVFLPVGYHFRKRAILEDISSNMLMTFLDLSKKEISFAQKYEKSGKEQIEAWLLTSIIFKIDIDYRIFDASLVLSDQINDLTIFVKENKFSFQSNIEKVLYGKHTEESIHTTIETLAKTCDLNFTLFENQRIQPPKPITTTSSREKKCSDLFHLIDIMGLEKHFPQNLTTNDILTLRDSMFNSPRTIKDLPWAILRRAIAIDYNFREKVLYDYIKVRDDQMSQEQKSPENSKKGYLHPVKRRVSKKYHPMDIFMALWYCSDPFLKRLLANKIATCQLALPLMFEDLILKNQLVLSLWPIRDIYLDENPDCVISKSLKTVSFVRLGRLTSISKSKIINKFIRAQNEEHNTFYHRDCDLGSCKRLISNGIIEVSWYIPRKDDGLNNVTKDNDYDELTETLCILNLRGDAREFREQLSALLILSDVVVVMSEYQCLKEEQSLKVMKNVHAARSSVIIMTEVPGKDNTDSDVVEEEEEGEDQNGAEEGMENVKKEDGKYRDQIDEEQNELNGQTRHADERNDGLCKEATDFFSFYENETGSSPERTSFLSTLEKGKALNESELKEGLKRHVSLAVKHIKHPQSLDEKKMLLPDCVNIDENNIYSLRGSYLSEDIFTDVENTIDITPRKQTKDRVLPLQGEFLWHKWCSEQKHCFRSGKKSVSENDYHKNRMKTIRIWQVLRCVQNQDTIKKFIRILYTHIKERETITFFLQWMKFHMDCRSRKTIPKLFDDFFKSCSQYETTRTQPEVDKKIVEELKMQIKNAEENLARASFGLEHFFREMGQLYEAFMFCEKEKLISLSCETKHVIAKMPFIAAKLLYWGHPLEIMDGDAATVQDFWIQAVFKEIRSIIEESKTLYIISVLGIQSSGKSTLLNTMFGLQFAVSAGRCTRGIYAQLIPVDKQRSKLKFDYALVIDTEGLKAPELAGEKFNHDNELATLVIGLADVALINIKGEAISDMEDVLQIVVHAIIRLKNANEDLNINQSCVFVHQNVSASNAGKSTFLGSQKITTKLDEMTKHIAEEEKMANVMRFTDVIAFNPVQDIIHIPDLWKGVPPMAPASPEYSKKVMQVSKCILYDVCDSKNMFLNCENTSIHLENLWKGILSEDFVFSFRNALEVKAFKSLETEFQALTWRIEVLKLQYLHRDLSQIGCSTTSEDLQNSVSEVLTSFIRSLHDITEKCNDDLQDFFEKSDLSDYMIHWKERKTKELFSISNSIKTEIETKIQTEKGKCEALFESNRKMSSIKEQVIAKAVEFAKTVKNEQRKMKKNEVENRFEVLWKEWLNKLAPEISERTINNKVEEMKTQIENEVRKKFDDHKVLFEKICKTTNMPKENVFSVLTGYITEMHLDEKDIDVHSKKEKILKFFNLKDYLQEKIMEYLKKNGYIEKTISVLDKIFEQIDKYFQTQNRNIEYNSAHFSQVLKYVTDGFREHNDNSSVHEYKLTLTLEIKISLLVQNFAIFKFKTHVKKFELNNSLRSKMARCRPDVESLFVGMYFQTADEELATSIICNHIKPALEKKILGDLYIHICRVITHSEFQNRKEPLIKAVLTDLANKHEFKEYLSYIHHSKLFVHTWIEQYTVRLFTKTMDGDVSMLKKYIKQCLDCACETVIETANKCASIPCQLETDNNESPSTGDDKSQPTDWHNWIRSFRDDLVKKNFPIPADAFQPLLRLKVKEFKNLFDNIQSKMRICSDLILEKLLESSLLSLAWGEKRPFEEIMTSLWRCEKVCPWCLEPCIKTSSEDTHACIQHRPGGVSGSRWYSSKKLLVESCEFKIQSTTQTQCGSWCKCSTKSTQFHPCKEFKSYMTENWDITSSSDMSASKYWNWVFKEFKNEFVKSYKSNDPEIPNSDTFNVTKEEAIESLSIYCPDSTKKDEVDSK